jgi:hypothetical protein
MARQKLKAEKLKTEIGHSQAGPKAGVPRHCRLSRSTGKDCGINAKTPRRKGARKLLLLCTLAPLRWILHADCGMGDGGWPRKGISAFAEPAADKEGSKGEVKADSG